MLAQLAALAVICAAARWAFRDVIREARYLKAQKAEIEARVKEHTERRIGL